MQLECSWRCEKKSVHAGPSVPALRANIGPWGEGAKLWNQIHVRRTFFSQTPEPLDRRLGVCYSEVFECFRIRPKCRVTAKPLILSYTRAQNPELHEIRKSRTTRRPEVQSYTKPQHPESPQGQKSGDTRRPKIQSYAKAPNPELQKSPK